MTKVRVIVGGIREPVHRRLSQTSQPCVVVIVERRHNPSSRVRTAGVLELIVDPFPKAHQQNVSSSL